MNESSFNQIINSVLTTSLRQFSACQQYLNRNARALTLIDLISKDLARHLETMRPLTSDGNAYWRDIAGLVMSAARKPQVLVMFSHISIGADEAVMDQDGAVIQNHARKVSMVKELVSVRT